MVKSKKTYSLALIFFLISAFFLTIQPPLALAETALSSGITRVQEPIKTTVSGSTTTATLTLLEAPTAGNLLLATIGWEMAASITSIIQTGVTWSNVVNASDTQNVQIWKGTVNANASVNLTVTWNTTVIDPLVEVIEYSGVSSVVDKTASHTGVSNNAVTGTTDITTEPNLLAFGAVYAWSNVANIGQSLPTNNFTLIDGAQVSLANGHKISMGILENVTSTNSTVSSGVTIESSSYYAACIATFKPLPIYSNLAISTTTANTNASFSAIFNSINGLTPNGQWQYGTNNTGAWDWTAAENFTATPETVHAYRVLNSTVGNTVSYMWNFTGNSGVSVSTGIQSFNITDSAPTCTQYAALPIQQGYNCSFTSQWNDNLELSGWIFNSNTTGTSTNTTWTAFSTTPDWANVTQTLPDVNGEIVTFQWYVNDTGNNWATTGPISLTAVNTLAPTYSNVTYTSNIPGSACTFSVQWQGVNGLSGYIFSTNTTGVWANFSYAQLYNNPDFAITLTSLPSTQNTPVGFRWYANDTDGLWGDTGILTLTTSITESTGGGGGGGSSTYVNPAATETPSSTSLQSAPKTTSPNNFLFLVGIVAIFVFGVTIVYSRNVTKKAKKQIQSWNT